MDLGRGGAGDGRWRFLGIASEGGDLGVGVDGIDAGWAGDTLRGWSLK